MFTVDLSAADLVLVVTALNYFQRDIEDGEDLTAGGEPVSAAEVEELANRIMEAREN